MNFIDKYNEIMGEGNTMRTHAPIEHVSRTYDEILNSVGAYTDEKLGKDKLNMNALTKDKKIDAVKQQLGVEFKKDGINKTFRDTFKKKGGYEVFIKIIDELDLWREIPPAS